jgi:hypothetical protein
VRACEMGACFRRSFYTRKQLVTPVTLVTARISYGKH